MNQFRPINSRLVFEFVDRTQGGNFTNKTSWGFEIQQKTDEIKRPRWGKVLQVGSDISAVKEGQYVLIEPMMWTLGFEHEGKSYWTTSEEKVMAVADQPIAE
jgi:co-chaperonin GroES (HSP10)